MSALLSGNIFTMQADDARRLAHRGELKHERASNAVRNARIGALHNIDQRLATDSEKAADSHSEQAGRLQEELKGIDQKHVDCVLSGTELPAKLVARRSAILDEITQLNRILEERCEANRRAAVPIKREIQDLTMQVTSEGALRNRLAALCSPVLRRQRLLNSHKVQWAITALNDARRMAGILQHNLEVAQRDRTSVNEQILTVRVGDWQQVIRDLEREVQGLQAQDREIEAAALAE